ncbi:MAG TPA: carboxypeptidase regulatory-like domain-containing protein [Gemmatimonadaceae bacterium]|nr:carboxypeptidase regulatory-like domain-containing protein [Gemmatimonadaceae bacterium]
MIRTQWLALGFLALFVASRIPAQQPGAQSSPSATVTISGTVYDSLAGRPLAGADIMLGGNAPPIMTDSLGNFSASGLTPGVYQVGVFHSRLDTLDLALASAPFSAAAGPNTVNLAIPSAATLIARHCGRAARKNEALITGKVESIETMRPVAGADVSLAWTEVTLPVGGAAQVARKEAYATTDSSGHYTFCGVPGDLNGTIQATAGVLSTPVLPVRVDVEASAVVAKSFFVSRSTPSAGQRGRVTGIVRQAAATGLPLEDARVEVSGTEVLAATDKDGSFALNNVPVGTQLIVFRKVGYASQSLAIDVLPNQQPRLAVALPKFVSYLDPVVVTARVSHALETVGFEERKKRGLGQYVTAADIEKHNYNYMTEIVRSRVPFAQLERRTSGPALIQQRRTTSRGGACVRYFVDDVEWFQISATDIDAINPKEVAGIEFYRGSSTPVRYSSGAVGDCTTVVIWTKTRVGI